MILIFVEESDRRNNALSLQTKKEKRKEEEKEWKEKEVWKRTDCSAKEIAYGSSESYS